MAVDLSCEIREEWAKQPTFITCGAALNLKSSHFLEKATDIGSEKNDHRSHPIIIGQLG